MTIIGRNNQDCMLIAVMYKLIRVDLNAGNKW
jgi:hypothetical protein